MPMEKIEKLPYRKDYPTSTLWDWYPLNTPIQSKDIIDKINEIIDFCNNMKQETEESFRNIYGL